MIFRKITTVHKPSSNSIHQQISHVGNPAEGWLLTREEVIERIRTKKEVFFVLDKTGKSHEVGIVDDSGTILFLRAHTNGVWNNTLLSVD